MAALVLTVLGDDRTGLVDTLATVVADHGGNWDRAQMARLAGKFAGVVLVSVPDDRAAELRSAIEDVGTDGTLAVTVASADATESAGASATLSISGADRPGVLREVTHVLARRAVSIETLDTATGPAPMAGGEVFEAAATLLVPDGVDVFELRAEVEASVPGFLVEIETLPT